MQEIWDSLHSGVIAAPLVWSGSGPRSRTPGWLSGQAFASRTADLGSIPAFAGDLVNRSSHTSDLDIGTLQGTWCEKV